MAPTEKKHGVDEVEFVWGPSAAAPARTPRTVPIRRRVLLGAALGVVVVGGVLVLGSRHHAPAGSAPTAAQGPSAGAASPPATTAGAPAPTASATASAPGSTAPASVSASRTTHAAPHTTQAAPAVAPPTTAAQPIPPPDNVLITDTADGFVLDLADSGTTAGTLIGTWAADGTKAQRWHLVNEPGNGGYAIYSELTDLTFGLEANTNPADFGGNPVTTLQPRGSTPDKRWTAQYVRPGIYELINHANGQCLQGAGQGVADATATCDSSNNHQLWKIAG
ncbi:MAG TPA: RICIN domain-containing protein [Actinocrinis sp.]|nr:RICIN domain-containing protein [Actinocrinis sp.]